MSVFSAVYCKNRHSCHISVLWQNQSKPGEKHLKVTASPSFQKNHTPPMSLINIFFTAIPPFNLNHVQHKDNHVTAWRPVDILFAFTTVFYIRFDEK